VFLMAAPLIGSGKTPTIKTYPLGTGASGASGIAKGDINGDGLLDIVTCNASTSNISVLLNSGNGSFQSAQVFPTGGQPESVALADFNRDGKLDVVTANFADGTVSVLFGNGDGTFQPHRDFSVGIQTQSVVVGDMNGDGISDIVVASVRSGTVDTLLSNGDGTFQPPIVYYINNGYAGMTQIAIGDINRDGIPDVVGIYGFGQGFQVLAGNGDGSLYLYSHELSTGTIGYPKGLALGDFNNDGRLDVALGLYESREVGVSLNRDAGKAFAPPIGSQSPPAPTLLAVADINGDGNLDAISTGLNTNVLHVALGDGTGSLAAGTSYKVGHPLGAVVGNFNGNNRPAIAYVVSGSVGVLSW
jgi:VCBS repeat protein